MAFPLQLYLAALLGAFFATILSFPWWRQWSLRVGLVDDPGHRKIHSAPVSLAGGLAVMTGILLPVAIGIALVAAAERGVPIPGLEDATVEKLTYGLGARAMQLIVILSGLSGMLLLGWLDDRHELNPLPKFIGQFVIAGLVAAAGIRITLFVPSLLVSYTLTILWIVGITNALNFLDNMNGLCAGIGAIAAAGFAVAAARNGQYLVASIALLGTGSLLGFLPWNYPRASAFLGDAGSHVTGFLLAILAILPSFYSPERPHRVAVLSPLLVLVVPLADLLAVTWIRLRAGRPPWVGDTNHFSHRLVRKGLTRAQAVAVLWAAGVIGACVALAL